MKPVDEEQELTRALAQETSPLASSLGALQGHGPNAAELASLASRLALQGLDVSVSQPPPARLNPWKRWGWAGLGGVFAVSVGLALRGSSPVPHAVLAAAPVEASPAPSTVVKRGAAAQQTASVAGTRAALRERPTPGVEVPMAANAVTNTSGAAPSPLLEKAKGVRGFSSPAGDFQGSVKSPTDPSVASARASTGAASSAARGASSSAAASAGAVDPPSEIELLRDARLQLRQSPARALELTDEHGRLYPQGKLTQERELIAVSALVALGRRAGALSRAASFERHYPTSPYRKQMGDLLR